MVKSWEWDKVKDIMFIDMEKAFDRVPHERFWIILNYEEYEILTPILREAIKSTFSKLKSDDTPWFKIRSGIRQWGVLSPLLFIIFVDYCIKEIGRSSEEVPLAYADDRAIVCD